MKATTRRTARLAWMAVALIVGLGACQRLAQQEKIFADLYPDYQVFSPASLALGHLAIEDAGGGFGGTAEIGKLRFSNTALILLDETHGAPGFTVGELSEQIDRGTTPLLKPNCFMTSVFLNQKMTIDTCVLIQDAVLFASYQEQTGAPAPTQPFLRARLARALDTLPIFRCKLTVSGATSCQNSCCCGACVDCTFVSADGLIRREHVPQPSQSPDSTSFLPCNSMNQC